MSRSARRRGSARTASTTSIDGCLLPTIHSSPLVPCSSCLGWGSIFALASSSTAARILRRSVAKRFKLPTPSCSLANCLARSDDRCRLARSHNDSNVEWKELTIEVQRTFDKVPQAHRHPNSIGIIFWRCHPKTTLCIQGFPAQGIQCRRLRLVRGALDYGKGRERLSSMTVMKCALSTRKNRSFFGHCSQRIGVGVLTKRCRPS